MEKYSVCYLWGYHTVGLCKNGIVVTTNKNNNVRRWRGMISIACENYYTIGLNKNERMLLAGDVNENQYNIYNWEELIAVACGNDHIVGLCKNEMLQLVQYIGNYLKNV